MMMKILPNVLEAIVAHARSSCPLECCGILLSEPTRAELVTGLLPAENTADDPRRRYILGRQAHLRAVELESAGAARIAGYYHSHPGGGCRPTQHDLEQAVPETRYLIIGLTGQDVRWGLWRLRAGRFESEPLVVGA